MADQQSYALRLADELEAAHQTTRLIDLDAAAIATELRRLAAVEAEREADRAAMRQALRYISEVDYGPWDNRDVVDALRERLEAKP